MENILNEQKLRDLWNKHPRTRINISTKLRREIMLGNNLTVMHEGKLFSIVFYNLGGGVWEAFCEISNPRSTS